MRDHRKDNKTVPERIVGASAVAATITLVGGVLMVGGQPVSAATIEVNSLDDDGAGDLTTFREALAVSADGDTITFDPALFTGGPGTITALAGRFVEGDEVAIAGPGAAVLTLTNLTGDVLYLYDGGQTISGLTIGDGSDDGIKIGDGPDDESNFLPLALTDIVIDGAGDDGIEGDVLEDVDIGDLVLTRVTITGSSDRGVNLGGHVGALTILDSTITDNGADGIELSATVDGDVTITDSLMSGNGDSGAYINDIEGALTITRSDFDNNDNEGFETREVAGAVVVEESSFSGNYDVGLHFHSDLNSDVTVTNSTIDNNGGVGLDIRYKVDGVLSITKSTFSDNGDHGVFHSGYTVGDVDITDSTFDNNGDSGAELHEIQSNLSISESSFSDNSVDGLVLSRSVVGDVTITDSTFDNSGSGSAGTALYVVSVQGAVSIGGSTFSNNSAPVVLKRVIGASEIVNSTFTGNDGEAVIEFDSIPAPTSQLAIRNSTISGNTPSVALVTTSDDVIQIDNSIVTDNGGAPVGEVLDDPGDPEIGSVDTKFSLVPVGAALGASNVETDAPLLGSLADNGGPTLTMLPLTDSPALDAGDPAFVAPPAKDQRGVDRVKGVAIDIGAVEVAPLFVTSLTPTRYLDTRTTGMTFDGQFQANGIRPSESTLTLDVGGRGDVPADAQAVVVNVTAVRASGKGFVTAYPCDADRPLASSLNYDAGVNMANELIVTLPASGDVCLFTKTETHLLADVVGYVPAESGYGGLTPARLLDTRPTGETTDGDFEGGVKPGAGNQLELQVAGRGRVPADARVVIVNITSVAADSPGFVTVHPCLATRPVVSSLNFTAGTNRANEVIAQLDADGKLCVFNNKSTHLVVDVVGWLPAGAGYTAVSPARLVDTRTTGETIDGSQEAGGIRPADSELVVPVANRAEVPDSATAVVVNITAIGATQKGFITVYDCEGARPAASSLNYVAGVNSPNELIAGLNADGEICVYTLHSIHIAVDVVGYITD